MSNRRTIRAVDGQATVNLDRLIHALQAQLEMMLKVQAQGHHKLTREELARLMAEVAKAEQTHKTLATGTAWLGQTGLNR